MGRTAKRNKSVAEDGADVVGVVIGYQDTSEGKGKFPERIESEIAELRERMRSSRKAGSVGAELDGPNAATKDPRAKSKIPEIVRDIDGVFRPFVEKASTKEVPSSTGSKRSNEDGEGRGVPSSTERPSLTSLSAPLVVSSTPDENRRKLRALIQKVKWELTQDGKRPADAGDLDEAFAEFVRVENHCEALCTVLVGFEVKRRTELYERMGKGGDEPISHEELVRALEKAPSLMEVREWRETVAVLTARLAERVPESASGAPDSPLEGAETAVGSAGIYFQQHIRVKQKLNVLTQLLEFPTSENLPPGTSSESDGPQGAATIQVMDPTSMTNFMAGEARGPATPSEHKTHRLGDTTTQEVDISGRGDAILEFPVALGGMSDDDWPRGTPAPRKASFRVSSHFLAETSPVFSKLFSGPAPRTTLAHARPGVARDGSRVSVYRMSPLLPGEILPLQILLYAAHMHNDKIPRTIPYEHFIAIANLCLRFQCTTPVELFVEMCWLPNWVHKSVEAMPDGLLLISYAFGIRRIFTRMTKSVILNVECEAELDARQWPPELKEKIWAVRQAKVEQIYACCAATVHEYLRPPRKPVRSTVPSGRPKSIFELDDAGLDKRVSLMPAPTSQSLFPSLLAPSTSPVADATFPTSTPRCPKGSHECDAANLGYFMIVLGELQLLPVVMSPGALAPGAPGGAAALPPRSLAQLVRILQRVPSPPNAIHKGGVCDPMPAFRGAVIDIYNSLLGITLFDVTGKHGYAISRRHERSPQRRPVGMGSTGVEVPEGVAVGLLRAVDRGDVQALAMTSRPFYDAYKKHEAELGRAHGEWRGGARDTFTEPPLEVLTEEEARRIIWPESPPAPAREEAGPSEPPPLDMGGAEPEGAREKFRAEDALFTEGKVLSVIETKQLTVEHDAYLGMHREREKVEVEGCV